MRASERHGEPRRRPRADRLNRLEVAEPWHDWRPDTVLTTTGWNMLRDQIEDLLGGEIINEPDGWDDGSGEAIPGEYENPPEDARSTMCWSGIYAPGVMRAWFDEPDSRAGIQSAVDEANDVGDGPPRHIATLTEVDLLTLQQPQDAATGGDVRRTSAYISLLLTAPWLRSSVPLTANDVTNLQQRQLGQQNFAEQKRLAYLEGVSWPGFEKALDTFLETLTVRSMLGYEPLITHAAWQQFEETLVVCISDENRVALEQPTMHLGVMRAAAHCAIFSQTIQEAMRRATDITARSLEVLATTNAGDRRGIDGGSNYEPQCILAAVEFLSAQNCRVRPLHSTQSWTHLEYGHDPAGQPALPPREA